MPAAGAGDRLSLVLVLVDHVLEGLDRRRGLDRGATVQRGLLHDGIGARKLRRGEGQYYPISRVSARPATAGRQTTSVRVRGRQSALVAVRACGTGKNSELLALRASSRSASARDALPGRPACAGARIRHRCGQIPPIVAVPARNRPGARARIAVAHVCLPGRQDGTLVCPGGKAARRHVCLPGRQGGSTGCPGGKATRQDARGGRAARRKPPRELARFIRGRGGNRGGAACGSAP